jgi:hypothetical protein
MVTISTYEKSAMARRAPRHRGCTWIFGILLLGFVARDASPQTPRRSTRSIKPGETISSVFHAQRRWHRVIVDVTCQPSS